MASWRHFGFQFTPFSTNPLEPVETGPDAYSLFVGRNQELGRLLDHIRTGESGSRLVVEGPLGSGKTSLLTRAKIQLGQGAPDDGPYFIQTDHVRLRTDSTFRTMCYQIVDSVLSTVLSPGFPHQPRKGSDLAQAIRLLAGGYDRQGGASVAGFGGQAGKTTIPPFVSPQVDWIKLLKGVSEDIVAFGYEGLVIHINNLETMVQHDLGALQRLLHDARDLFQVPGCHFVLVAPTGFSTNILGGLEAVRTIFPTVPVSVDLMPEKQFGAVVQRRYKHAAAGGKYLPPVSLKVAQELYRLTGGSLRATFQVIETWVELLDPLMVRTAHRVTELVELLKPQFETQVQQLPVREQEVLQAAVQLGDPFRQKGIVRLTGQHQANASERMSKLEQKRFIVFEGQDGTSKWYRLDERTLIAYWGDRRGPGGEEAEASLKGNDAR